MTNNPTIDGVSRKTIERIADHCKFWKDHAYIEAIGDIEPELRALLDAPALEPTNELREHCKQCAEVVKTWPEWKQNCLGGAPAVERQEPKASQVPVLRAMAANYRNGHSWDFLDGEAVSKAADEITALQSTIAQLQARVQELESGRGEPVAWAGLNSLGGLMHCMNREGYLSVSEKPRRYHDIALYTAPPAPVAALWEIRIPDEPQNPDSPAEYFYAQNAANRDLLLMREGATVVCEYACLDATAALNGVRK